MKHLGTKPLETSRLILRPFRMEDAQAMYENWAKQEEVTKYLTWPAYKSLEDAYGILKMWTGSYIRPDFYQWAIVLKELAQPIGSISVVDYDDSVEAAEIGYCIGRNFWGQGIMPEALQAVLTFLFEEVGANRVEAKHAVENPNSGRVMIKCGMSYEGTLRQAARSNYGISDICCYSILKKEFNLG